MTKDRYTHTKPQQEESMYLEECRIFPYFFLHGTAWREIFFAIPRTCFNWKLFDGNETPSETTGMFATSNSGICRTHECHSLCAVQPKWQTTFCDCISQRGMQSATVWSKQMPFTLLQRFACACPCFLSQTDSIFTQVGRRGGGGGKG